MEIRSTAIENTNAPRNLPHAGSSAPAKTLPTTLRDHRNHNEESCHDRPHKVLQKSF